MDYILDGFSKAFSLLISGDEVTWSAIFTTLRVSSLSIVFSLLAGVPLGFTLGYYDFFGKRTARLFVDTLLALPTVVVGLLVYAFISRRGPLGELGLLFTVPGIAVGQMILAIPIVASLTATAVEEMDNSLRMTLMTLGASGPSLAISFLWEGRFGVLAAAVTAYGRIISEVGVSMMVGGNIKWHTRTITTAIALETGKGQFGMGVALGVVLLSLAVGVNTFMAFLRKRS